MLMLTREELSEIRKRTQDVIDQANQYFRRVDDAMQGAAPLAFVTPWILDDDEFRDEIARLRSDIKALSVDIAGAARGSPLVGEADLQELRHCTRQMLASVWLREYQHTGVYVHHDEGVVLGVDPPSHDEKPIESLDTAGKAFAGAARKVLDLVDLIAPSTDQQQPPRAASAYRPNTAFIMMPIDESKPRLEDVKTAIKDVFSEFGIVAVTADDIEHEDSITDRVLDEIDTSEFLIADLSLARPNVYYEVGYAHAKDKRVVLYRERATKLHFDIAGRNCPEYRNTTDLKKKLRKRLIALTNKGGSGTG